MSPRGEGGTGFALPATLASRPMDRDAPTSSTAKLTTWEVLPVSTTVSPALLAVIEMEVAAIRKCAPKK